MKNTVLFPGLKVSCYQQVFAIDAERQDIRALF